MYVSSAADTHTTTGRSSF